MQREIKKIGILTAGGDCPGLNPVIRSVVRTAILKYGLEVVGFNLRLQGAVSQRRNRTNLRFRFGHSANWRNHALFFEQG